MGALTLKSFPFELRGWDIEKFESIDPTDGFGSNTRVYINKNQVVQIEPDYNIHTLNTWLTDKGRQFFDGVFGTWNPKIINKNQNLTNNSWIQLINTLAQTIYISTICRKQYNKNQTLTIVFENLSLEALSILTLFSQKYSFIKLKRAENYTIDNELESTFQLNSATNKSKLSSSTLCLLVSNNPRYEGYYLNLSLRQRFLKGNFKCLVLGSLINITFPVSFLGSNLNILKSISEGNNLICQELKYAKNPMLVFNQELLKRQDSKNAIELLKILKHANIFNNTWNGLNMLNPSLHDGGINNLNKFSAFNTQDLNKNNSIYFLNVSTNKIHNLNKIIELKLLNFTPPKIDQGNNFKVFLDQNSNLNYNISFYKNIASCNPNMEYKFIPSNKFYDTDETFINTEGFIKRVTKLIIQKNTRSNWQIIRKIFKHFSNNLYFLNQQENNLITYNSKKLINFKNYINFQYQATQTLTNVSFYLSIKNNSFIKNEKNLTFKPKHSKLTNTKLKYWIDDFFSGGKDEFSEHSLILTNCSKILRSETTNFF
nr:NADH dehydrogenase subunit 11b [Schizostauron trachyderma]